MNTLVLLAIAAIALLALGVLITQVYRKHQVETQCIDAQPPKQECAPRPLPGYTRPLPFGVCYDPDADPDEVRELAAQLRRGEIGTDTYPNDCWRYLTEHHPNDLEDLSPTVQQAIRNLATQNC